MRSQDIVIVRSVGLGHGGKPFTLVGWLACFVEQGLQWRLQREYFVNESSRPKVQSDWRDWYACSVERGEVATEKGMPCKRVE